LYGLLNLSAYFGHEKRPENRDLIANKMTPEQIAKVQELSNQMLKQIETRKGKGKK